MAVGGPLFGNATARTTSKALVEFRAGKMTLNTSTKMVSPDKRKGLVSVYQSDDHLMHLTWKDRTTGTLEDDLIIFPDDCEFQAVPACTTGRVFILKFKTSNKRVFFWMQEPKADKDEETCKKVNDALNNPPAPGSSRSAGSGGTGGLGGVLPPNLDFNNLGDSELQNLLNNMSQSQLIQLFGGSLGGGSGNMPGLASLLGGSGSGRSRQAAGTGRTRSAAVPATETPTPATPAPAAAAATPATPTASSAAAANPSIQLSDLQSILSNISVPPGAEGVGSGSAGPSVDLSTALTSEVLQPLLSNPDFLQKVKDFLPAEEREEGKDLTAADLKGTVQSPQFKQAVSMFSMALQSGQLGPLVREFGLGEAAGAAADKGDLLVFFQALQKEAGAEEKKEKEAAPEDMALD